MFSVTSLTDSLFPYVTHKRHTNFHINVFNFLCLLSHPICKENQVCYSNNKKLKYYCARLPFGAKFPLSHSLAFSPHKLDKVKTWREWECLWVKIRLVRLFSNYCLGGKKTLALEKDNLIYFKKKKNTCRYWETIRQTSKYHYSFSFPRFLIPSTTASSYLLSLSPWAIKGMGNGSYNQSIAFHVCHFFLHAFFLFFIMGPWGKSATVYILHRLQGLSFLPWSTSTYSSFANTVAPSTVSCPFPSPHLTSPSSCPEQFLPFLKYTTTLDVGFKVWLYPLIGPLEAERNSHVHHNLFSQTPFLQPLQLIACWHQHPVQPCTGPHQIFVIEEALKGKAFM